MEQIFNINDWILSLKTKDYVKITNGIPIDETDRSKGIKPTEGVVLRVIGLDSDNVPVLAWSYIVIEAQDHCKVYACPALDRIFAGEAKGNSLPIPRI
jgi:hypothetical protein